jgi:hypothetical protein
VPTPITSELALVVVSVADGAPDAALPEPTAPIAPAPFAPEVLTPVKLMIVMEADTDCESVAWTDTRVSKPVANARQISAVPSWAFVLRTSTQVNPAPVTLFTVAPVEVASVEIKASSSSFPAEVENAGEVIVVLEVFLSTNTLASAVIGALPEDCAVKSALGGLAPFTVNVRLGGVKVVFALLGVTVYVPFKSPGKV